MGSRNFRVFVRLFQPMRWSIKARRLFLVSLPLAIPAWILAVIATLILGHAMEIQQVLRQAWNAPPKRRHARYSYYGYGK